jgi:hypothetical protein
MIFGNAALSAGLPFAQLLKLVAPEAVAIFWHP